MEQYNRNFRGIWIPREIWLEENLTIQEKVLLVEIDSLEDEQRGCYASNKYFADFFGLPTQRISKVLQNLKIKGYVDLSYVYQGKEIKERQIRIKRPPFPQVSTFDDRYQQNDITGINKSLGGYQQNDKENNTYINNTYIDNTTTNNTETIFEFIEINFGRVLSPIEYELIQTWKDNELTRYAIKKAVLNQKYNLKYIDKILFEWKKNNITSVQQAQANDEQFKNKNTNTVYKQKEVKIPEWFGTEQEIKNISDSELEEFENIINSF